MQEDEFEAARQRNRSPISPTPPYQRRCREIQREEFDLERHLEDLIDLTGDSVVAALRVRDRQEADTLIEVSPTWQDVPVIDVDDEEEAPEPRQDSDLQAANAPMTDAAIAGTAQVPAGGEGDEEQRRPCSGDVADEVEMRCEEDWQGRRRRRGCSRLRRWQPRRQL